VGSCQFVRKARRGLAANYVFVRVVAAGYLLVPELVLGVSTRHFEFWVRDRLQYRSGRFDWESGAVQPFGERRMIIGQRANLATPLLRGLALIRFDIFNATVESRCHCLVQAVVLKPFHDGVPSTVALVGPSGLISANLVDVVTIISFRFDLLKNLEGHAPSSRF